MSKIDPRACIAEGAKLEAEVEVGPFAVIGSEVSIGKGTVVAAHAVIEGRVSMGAQNYIGSFAHVGGIPQHVNYKGEDTSVVMGDRNRIRENVTIHKGTAEGNGETKIGSDNFIMVGSHIAHDCIIGNRIIMANLATLAGHVEVEDDAVFGGFVAMHQFCRVGRVVMAAAGTKMPRDAPPYSLVGGDPPRFVGLNRIGLKRTGMPEEAKKAIRKAYRLIFHKGVKLEEGVDRAESEFGQVEEVKHIIEFIRSSSRGIIRD